MIPSSQVILLPGSCQHLCCDDEGWGPLDRSRSTLTPCFLNLLILFVSFFGLIAGGPTIWRLARRNTHEAIQKHWPFWIKLVPDFIFVCFSLGLVFAKFLLAWAIPNQTSYVPLEGSENECPSNRATLFSILTFSWMTPMMKHGYKQYITEDDLWDLAKEDTARTTARTFQHAWIQQQASKEKASLWFALFRGFGAVYAQGPFFKGIADVLAILQPQLLRLFISFEASYRSPQQQPLNFGVAIALSIFAVSVAQSLCLHQCFQRLAQTGIKLKSALVSAIYRKSLVLSNEARGTKSTGDIVNLMAVDSQRLQDVTQFSQHLWSAPLQIFLCTVSLYSLLGYSMFAGVIVMIAMIPVNGAIAKSTKVLQKQQMKNKDARSKLTAEVITNMKSIKLFAWGSAFANRIRNVRNSDELVALRKIGTLQAVSSFVGSVTPFLVACSAFGVHVLVQKKPLTAEIVFPAIALFQLLTSPLTILPAAISSITEASVAVIRLSEFLSAEELQPDAIVHEEAVTAVGEESVNISDATFKWSAHDKNPSLERVSLSVNKGDLCCLVGRVGAGKSSVLHALLGDQYKTTGTVTQRGSIAYVAQQPWVLNATVRDNITFGRAWDPDFYVETVTSCALVDDLAQLPNGDQTQVGDKGITLSGGQKARLTLARAVYAMADIYLLDDCLSAVDQHVGKHLIEEVLGPRGLLKDKTRILATNSTPVLFEATNIVLIRDGKILEKGTYDELKANGGDFVSLIGETGNLSQSASVSGEDDTTKQKQNTEQLESTKADDKLDTDAPIFQGPENLSGSMDAARKTLDVEAAINKSEKHKESTRQGSVKWKVYGEYAEASSLFAVILYVATLVGAQAAEIGSNIWLKQWSDANDDPNIDANIEKYLGVYVALGLGSAGLVIAQSSILWLWCSIENTSDLLMGLSKYTRKHDGCHSQSANDFLRNNSSRSNSQSILQALFSVAVISSGAPVFIILALPIAFLYSYMQRYYLGAKRELKRLDGASRSPVFAHFQESLGGLTTIRAFSQQERFSLESERRLDSNMKAYIPSITANRWLGIRLEFIGSIIIISTAGLTLVRLALGKPLSPGMVGLMISYAIQITQSFSSLVRATGEVETNIVSAERVLEYTHLPSEAPDVIPNRRPGISWPSSGSIRFINYSTRYRPELDLVLRDLNLNIQPGEKIGVVGRTGAGKSSLALALFRIIEPSHGSIYIDDIDISTIGVLDLRQRLTIIPQDPALFEGTVRENLDPGEDHDDTELWAALGGLDAKIYEGGSNLSQGQKQLVSLARAILKPSSILVLDEATAAVDTETDVYLQNALRGSLFSNRTVITIAHRINTVIDSDRIIVLEKGGVVEFDTPATLLQNKGPFYQLAKEAGLLAKL
ncbi:multidrug resistance-associated 1 [Fusarium longipes]|uniref:Multidrug resistance-associated 1 n=1 Tax=Fusarium longipes TaxID=694270 RepID=A0A395T9L2_9HYPO|nr:multidrug resistance-associated 1 [Fusarium longipes]